MKIFNHISDCKNLKNPVLTLGMYDGVHLGHQKIIENLNEIAREIGGESVLLTFEPHPRITLNKGSDGLKLITTLDEKIELLRKYGLKNLILHPFTKEFSQLSATEFVKSLLVEQIQIHTIVIGYDHHFGKGRKGNYELLNNLSNEFDFECIQIEEVKSEDLNISSTKIRKALLNGEIDFANQGLNRPYSLRGKVIHGDKLGRTLGFPTANLQTEKFKLIPAEGVYVVGVFVGDEFFKGLLSIGTRPTVTDSAEKRVEVYILDFNREIYGQHIELELMHRIREDRKFNSMEELILQMNQDKEFAINYQFNS